MSGFVKPLGLSPWEEPFRYAAWCRDAICVSSGGGEAPAVVSMVLETSSCLLRRTFSDVGRGAHQSCGGGSVVGIRLSSSEVGEIYSMESPVVMDCVPVSAVTKIRTGALWRAHPP